MQEFKVGDTAVIKNENSDNHNCLVRVIAVDHKDTLLPYNVECINDLCEKITPTEWCAAFELEGN